MVLCCTQTNRGDAADILHEGQQGGTLVQPVFYFLSLLEFYFLVFLYLSLCQDVGCSKIPEERQLMNHPPQLGRDLHSWDVIYTTVRFKIGSLAVK